MHRTSSQHNIEVKRESSSMMSLVSENEKLHKQNESLMKELSLIRNDFERMSQSGQKTVKNGRRKSCEITDEMINIQQRRILEEELYNAQMKINVMNRELKKKDSVYQNQFDKLTTELESYKNQYEMMKIKCENAERQLQEMKQTHQYQENYLEKSDIRITNDSQKIKQLSECNMRLTKLLEDRLNQLESLTKAFNQKNQEHMKEIEKYETLLKERSHKSSQSQGKGNNEALVKKIEALEKDKIKLNNELQKTRDLNIKEKQILQKEKQNVNLEKEKLHSDMAIIQQQLTDYYNQLQHCDQQLKQKDESIKQFQQSESYQGYQNIVYENEQQKAHISQLQITVGNLQQTNKALSDELLFLKTSAPLTNRTNLKTFFGLDSPFRNIADEQNRYNTTQKTRTQCSLDNRGRSRDKIRFLD